MLNDVLFDAFEQFRVQFHFVKNSIDFSFLIVQLHRAIAKCEKKSERDLAQLPVILQLLIIIIILFFVDNCNRKRNKKWSKSCVGLVDSNVRANASIK